MAGVRRRGSQGDHRVSHVLYPVMLARPVRGAGGELTPSEAVSAYAFSSTLSIQDITGDPTSGTTASRLVVRLQGSEESDALLFALCASPPGPRPTGRFGLPEIPSTGDAGQPLDYAAWVMISLPLLEDLHVIEAHITMDSSIAPLPGQPWDAEVHEAWQAALDLVDTLAHHTARPIRQLWITHPPDTPGPNIPGYHRAHTEYQAKLDLSVATDAQGSWADSVTLADDMNFGPDIRESMSDMYRLASEQLPRGDLVMDTIQWTPQRIAQASSRLADKQGEQITALITDPSDSTAVIAFSEVTRFAGAESRVVELGATFVRHQWRGQGLGRSAMMSAVSQAQQRWPETRVGYTSYPEGVPQVEALNASLNGEIISATTAWQKLGDYRA
ncbi:GNAT family N-acetyltransferase [Corynebacterium cystitidis]|nr:N-acetyltransferase [Corynebacterium cystitidis]